MSASTREQRFEQFVTELYEGHEQGKMMAVCWRLNGDQVEQTLLIDEFPTDDFARCVAELCGKLQIPPPPL